MEVGVGEKVTLKVEDVTPNAKYKWIVQKGDSIMNTQESTVFTYEFATAGEYRVNLTTTNAMAETENAEELARLKGKLYTFGSQVSGDVDRKMFPADEVLKIKKGAQVMMLNNDSAGRWINGTIGTVNNIIREPEEPDMIVVALDTGETVLVGPHHWDVFKFSFDTSVREIVSDTVGSFEQYPMRLAWAVTIHKAQGKTFDRVIVDMGRGAFATILR